MLALFVPKLGRALDPNINISQYAHSAWLIQDGYFSGTPRAVTQTTDGYIWVGTASGLLRFDGSRFLPWTFHDTERLPSTEIFSLLAAHDGSLWIGTRSGLAHFVNQKLVIFPDFVDTVHAILEDPSGTIWFSREGSGNGRKGPICRVSGGAIQCLDKSDGILPFACCAGPMVRDRTGSLWVGTDKGLIRWRAGSSTSYPITFASDGLDGVEALAAAADASLWLGMPWTGKGGGLERLKDKDSWEPVILPNLDSSTLRVTALFLDRDEGLWVGTLDQGIYHIHNNHVDRFGTETGLSGNFILGFFEDREGSVWVATSRGIDSFHQLSVTTFSTREGLSIDNVVSVLVSRDDTVWLANGTSLDSIKNDRISSVRSGKGLPGHEVTSLFEDHANRLWVGVDNDLFMYEHGHFHKVRRKDGSSTRFIVGITEDVSNNIWAEVSGSSRELICIQNLKVIEEYPESKIPSARQLAADAHGGVWLGLRTGNLARFRNGHVDVFPFPHETDSDVRQVVVNSDESVFGATAFGLVAWRRDKSQILTTQNGLPCNGIIGVVWGNEGALWLYTECGLVRIDKADLQKWWADPNTAVVSRVFGVFDGVLPGVPDFNPVGKSSDGKLWFANQFNLQSIDPNRLVQNKILPPVHLEAIIADRNSYSTTNGVRLPPLLRNLEIDYTALSFVNSRAVRFRYKLEGRDANWQEAGTRRQAFYNDLRPGRYRFQVIACNNDGLWNEQGATLSFIVAPAWYQTTWFKWVSLVVGIIVVSLLYLLDRRRYVALLRIRYDERLEERTRIARDLHDTLLQTIQGSKLVADHARTSISDPGRTQSLLDQLSEWLGRASLEGRTALESLQATKAEDLAAALRTIVENFQENCDIEFFMSMSDSDAKMIPLVRDEVYWIAYETIRNACRHSEARHVSIELTNDQNLELCIRDDGRGISEHTLREGKVGHFGLRGVRERASKIGAALTISSSLEVGTEVKLVVPGKLIFTPSHRLGLPSAMKWIRSLGVRYLG